MPHLLTGQIALQIYCGQLALHVYIGQLALHAQRFLPPEEVFSEQQCMGRVAVDTGQLALQSVPVCDGALELHGLPGGPHATHRRPLCHCTLECGMSSF